MNKVIQLLESTKQKQKEAIKQLPKMVDEFVATVAVEGEQFIKEIDQALLVLSAVVGQSEELLFSPDDIERIVDEKSMFNGKQFRKMFEK